VSDDGSKKWLCAWCEKPHDSNDPPCDNCGHHKFERAVVPMAPEDPDHEPEPIWVCPECGCQHQKNSPPCNRCGNATLEKQVPDYSEFDEIGAPTYYELLDTRYVLGVVVALLAGGLLVLGQFGIGPLAGLLGPDLAVTDVPGNADATGGIDFADARSAYVEALNERRTGAEMGALTRIDRLDAVAQFYNQRWVKTRLANGSLPSDERLLDALSGPCDSTPAIDSPAEITTSRSVSSFDSATELGTHLAQKAPREAVTRDDSEIGLDIHAGPGGELYATQFTC